MTEPRDLPAGDVQAFTLQAIHGSRDLAGSILLSRYSLPWAREMLTRAQTGPYCDEAMARQLAAAIRIAEGRLHD